MDKLGSTVCICICVWLCQPKKFEAGSSMFGAFIWPNTSRPAKQAKAGFLVRTFPPGWSA